MPYKVKVLKVEEVAKNVRRFRVERPEDYEVMPGQSTYISLPGTDKRPFSFSNFGENFIEFTVKSYPGGVSEKIGNTKPGSYFLIEKPFGIKFYRGPGVFIAGGTGITPYLCMIKHISQEEAKKSTLIYSNSTEEDIIDKSTLGNFFGKVIITLTEEKKKGYEHGRIDKTLLEKYIQKDKKYYACGSTEFVNAMREILLGLGIDKKDVY